MNSWLTSFFFIFFQSYVNFLQQNSLMNIVLWDNDMHLWMLKLLTYTPFIWQNDDFYLIFILLWLARAVILHNIQCYNLSLINYIFRMSKMLICHHCDVNKSDSFMTYIDNSSIFMLFPCRNKLWLVPYVSIIVLIFTQLFYYNIFRLLFLLNELSFL